MMFPARFLNRTGWINSAAGVLIVLLQRTPVVRVLATAESALTTPVGVLLRAFVPVAALGAVNSMAGASTSLVANVNQPAKATVGTPFSETVVIQGLGVSFAQSWAAGAGMPPGITPQGGKLKGGQWVVDPSTGTLTLSGTPTTAGTYSFGVSGYQYTGLTGPVTNATATIVVAAAPNSAPTITLAPSSVTVLTGGSTTLTVGYSGSPTPTFQWLKDGVAISGATSATLTLSNITFADAGAYSVKLTNSLGSATSPAGTVTVAQAPVAPAILTAPVSQSVVSGTTVTFAVSVSGTPTPTFQWLKNNSGIDSATGTTLTLPNVQLSDAGQYSVTVSNSQGTITSPAAALTVTQAAFAPVFSAPLVSETVAVGATAVFTAPAIGAPSPTYTWLLNGQTIPGAISSTLLIPNATAANAGAYTAIAKNSLGIASSPTAALVVASTNDPGHLTNLSVLTDLSPSVPTFTVGTVLGGAGTSGSKPLVIRAAGPALTAFGVSAPLASPTLAVLAGQTVVASNVNWGGSSTLAAAMASVGAFAYPSATSQDAAVFQTLPARDYTVSVSSAVPNASGSVLAEIYDATPAGTFTATTPRLINVSVLKSINAGGSLTLGFTVAGSTEKTVLIRAIGPGLAPFGVSSPLADPQLTLYDSTQTVIATNNDWSGDPALTQAMKSVGAFLISDPASKDAMFLRTLPAGGYTAVVTGNGGTGGNAIVEVYEVP